MSPQSRGPVFVSGHWEFDVGRRELRARGDPIPIGGRAFEIIEVLVQSAGDLVTKDDLMRRVWPGVVVGENTLQVHISALRKALGPNRNLLQTMSGRGYRLAGNWKVKPDSGLAEPDIQVQVFSRKNLSAVGASLPTAPFELIGRSTTIQHLQDLISAYRVVTVSGPGGIGKTVLALEVARRLLPNFPNGVWLVELVSLSNSALVAATVASALGLSLGGQMVSPDSVGRAIGISQILLVLDNCEHVIEEAAALAAAVVRLCPNTSVLTTSREVLRIDGEYVFQLAPLDVPPLAERAAGDIQDYSAAQLFISRIKAVSDFSLNGENLAAVALCCRRLDGIPLAIELAAARAAAFGVREVAARLDDRFELLTGGRRTALPRHQTLRATLDWSYQLLPESEQRFLRHYAVFPAGFTLEAAAAVTGAAGGGASHNLDAISNLVSKSLVTLDGLVPAGRWRLLETIRAYALGKLTDCGEAVDASRRHAAFYRDLVTTAAPASALEPTTEGLVHCVRELDNVRAAIEWAFSPDGDITVGIALTADYMPVWLHLSLIGECRDHTERALARGASALEARSRLRMLLNIGLAYALIYTGGEAEETRRASAVALEIAKSLDDIVAKNYALWATWAYSANAGDLRTAHRIAGSFSRLAIRSRSPARRLVADRLIGATLHYRGDQPKARIYLERVLANEHEISDGRHVVWFRYDIGVMARATLARVLCVQGLLDQACDIAWTSYEEAREANHALMLCHTLAEAVCSVALIVGDIATAEQSIAALMDAATTRSAGAWKIVGRCLEGALLIQRGEFRQGCGLLRAALASCRQTGWRLYFPTFTCALAEGLASNGQFAEAREEIERALVSADQGGERWYVPELLRIKSRLFLKGQENESAAAAEACLLASLEVSRRQGALFWELRAATDLAGLRADRNRHCAARSVLEPVYQKFTEGFGAAAMRSARAMLESLQV